MTAKRYDQAYFDRWYRDPRYSELRPSDLRREVALAVSLVEWLLGRPLRTVLDVGAGEGRWRAEIRRLRPKAEYLGVEPAEWPVERWGARRNLRSGEIGSLDRLTEPGPHDLVVCADVLHYLSSDLLRRGAHQLAQRTAGLLFCPTFTGADGTAGDHVGFRRRRRAGAYREALVDAGLEQVGPHAWVPRGVVKELAELERPLG